MFRKVSAGAGAGFPGVGTEANEAAPKLESRAPKGAVNSGAFPSV